MSCAAASAHPASAVSTHTHCSSHTPIKSPVNIMKVVQQLSHACSAFRSLQRPWAVPFSLASSMELEDASYSRRVPRWPRGRPPDHCFLVSLSLSFAP